MPILVPAAVAGAIASPVTVNMASMATAAGGNYLSDLAFDSVKSSHEIAFRNFWHQYSPRINMLGALQITEEQVCLVVEGQQITQRIVQAPLPLPLSELSEQERTHYESLEGKFSQGQEADEESEFVLIDIVNRPRATLTRYAAQQLDAVKERATSVRDQVASVVVPTVSTTSRSVFSAAAWVFDMYTKSFRDRATKRSRLSRVW